MSQQLRRMMRSLLILCSWLFIVSAGSAAPTGAPTRELNESPAELRLSVYGRDKWTTARNQPLHFVLVVSKATGTINLGSATRPLAQSVMWKLQNERGEPLDLPIKLLSVDAGRPYVVAVDRENPLFIDFGIYPEELMAAPIGNYLVTATLDGENSAPTSSNTVALSISAASPSPAEETGRDFLYGQFYVLDDNLDEAERYVNKLLTSDPNSVAGTFLRGQINVGRKRWKEAVADLQRAMELDQKAFAGLGKSHYHPPLEMQAFLNLAQSQLHNGNTHSTE